jgi:hypothetical protein
MGSVFYSVGGAEMIRVTYDQWLEMFGEDLDIADAESGADRELDYDFDTRREAQYAEDMKAWDKDEEPID